MKKVVFQIALVGNFSWLIVQLPSSTHLVILPLTLVTPSFVIGILSPAFPFALQLVPFIPSPIFKLVYCVTRFYFLHFHIIFSQNWRINRLLNDFILRSCCNVCVCSSLFFSHLFFSRSYCKINFRSTVHIAKGLRNMRKNRRVSRNLWTLLRRDNPTLMNRCLNWKWYSANDWSSSGRSKFHIS